MPPQLPRLIVITDPSLPFAALLERVGAALQAGAGIGVQLRAPALGGAAFLAQARALLRLCEPVGAPLFVNGRLDVALALGTHLHRPAHGFGVDAVRERLAGRWISAAVHDEDEARRAAAADLVLISPVFPPGSKPGDLRPPLGSEGFFRLAAVASTPRFALGGMTPERTRQLRPPGVAVVGAVLHAADPRAAARDFLSALDSCKPSRP